MSAKRDQQTLCIYHGSCFDGFTAAWVVWKKLGNLTLFHPGIYGEEPPWDLIRGRQVVIVDFSYSREVMEGIVAEAAFVTVLDHHKTAQAALDGLDGDGCRTVFDMERSGAGIAWDEFFGGARPPLVDYVEDRDLWRFKLPKSREINEAIGIHPMYFESWESLANLVCYERDKMIIAGKTLMLKQKMDIAKLLPVVERTMRIGGYMVPVANLPMTLTSDAGNTLAIGQSFAACYWDTPRGRVFSLRSTEGGMDVSEIAKLYGGGGHMRASGFTVPLGWEGDE